MGYIFDLFLIEYPELLKLRFKSGSLKYQAQLSVNHVKDSSTSLLFNFIKTINNL